MGSMCEKGSGHVSSSDVACVVSYDSGLEAVSPSDPHGFSNLQQVDAEGMPGKG